jgi:GT2 family glycosyltransferase
MKLSVVIVNYNVRFFLEQCLKSVEKSIAYAQSVNKDYTIDIYVVDNSSVDGSVEMVEKNFPDVHLIANQDNPGFSIANNQAIQKSEAEYALLLNPDTVVEEATFEKVIRFMDEHPEAGGLGVKMIDGSGRFLKESKRGLPTPMTAFYKIFGLSSLFPKSAVFSRYHLGNLDQDDTNEVEVLAGAFMLLRKSVLDKIGLLDEDYFMYGEDIDLSYRIIKEGYKNYYFPETQIIHYKGESTKKGSLNYVFVFYRAMIIFAKKHFSNRNAALFSFLINLAIYFRAFLAVLSRFAKRLALPLFDGALLFGGMYYQKVYWENNHRYVEGGTYPPEYDYVYMPAYIVIWLFSIMLAGAYDKPVKLAKLFRGLAGGTVAILVVYSLLPESLRTSRALILLGFVWAVMSLALSRVVLHSLKVRGFAFENDRKRMAVVGSQDEVARVKKLFSRVNAGKYWIGYVTIEPLGSEKKDDQYLGHIKQLNEITQVFRLEELIFCASDISSAQIIDLMGQLKRPGVEYRIVPPEAEFMIGSQAIFTPDDAFTTDLNVLQKNPAKRNKRIFDVLVSLVLLVLSPLFILFSGPRIYVNIVKVLFNQLGWVGLARQNQLDLYPKGVLDTKDWVSSKEEKTPEMIQRLNLLYAAEYSVFTDLQIIGKNLKYLARKV